MIFDKTTQFSDAQAVTASAASTDIVDLGVAGRNVGSGEMIPLFIGVNEDFATLTSLTVSVQTATDEAFTSPITVVSTGAIAVADLVAGYHFAIERVPAKVLERYVRVYYTVAGSDATAGSINAGIVMGVQDEV